MPHHAFFTTLISAAAAAIAAAAAAAAGASRRRRRRRDSPDPAGVAAAPVPVTAAEADRTVVCVDNGGRPFAVRIKYDRRDVTVYGRAKDKGAGGDGDGDDTWPEPLLTWRFERVFVGLDPSERQAAAAAAAAAAGTTPTTSSAPAPPPPPPAPLPPVWWHGGNSVLLDLGSRRYVFIGLVIYSFTALDDITDYVSTMGNSAVPYPFAIGTENAYCMIEDTYIPNHVLQRFSREERADPYSVLYSSQLGRWLPGADPSARPPDSPGPCDPGAMGAWCRHFQLPDRTLLVERDW